MEPPGTREAWLLLLLLGVSEANSGSKTSNPEEPRKTCQGIVNKGHYDQFALENTAECFSRCRPGSPEPCHLSNLQRYWLDLEIFLVENSSQPWNTPFLNVSVKNVSTSVSEDLHFSLNPFEVPRQVTQEEQKPPNRVRLPQSLFRSLQGRGEEVHLAVTILDIGTGMVFKGPQQSLEEGSRPLNDRLVGLSVGRGPIHRLPEPLEITFAHPQQPPNMTFTCVFWDVHEGPTGDWSSRGCSTDRGPERTVCRCDHLTFFTLLLRPVLDRATALALTRISQAGCGASMIFLTFTVILYVTLRFSWQRFKSEDAPKIHVALSVSLFLLNLAFFISLGLGTVGTGAACRARGAALHYFLLCTFTWMGLEALHLYLLVIKVFNTYISHYFLKLSAVGWGLPALVVIGTASADSYGSFAIRDQDLRISLELCWFCEKTAVSALHVTVHGYFLVTFLCSAVVLVLVAWKIFTLSSATAGKGQGQSWKGVLTVLGLCSLLGMTWGLAILTPLGLSTVYIFAVFNSLQGVFIFCWFLVLYFPSQRAATSSSGTARVDPAPVTSHG